MERRPPRLNPVATALLAALVASPALAAVPARGEFRLSAQVATGHAPAAMAVGDLNGDGNLDVVLIHVGDSTVTTLLGDGAGGLGRPNDVVVGPGLVGLALGDVDQDGHLDAAVSGSFRGSVYLLHGAGDGSLVLADSLHAPWTPGPIAIRDVDHDGALDLVVADLFFQEIVTARGNGAGGFTIAHQLPGFADPVAMAFGDPNGDGTTDLLVADSLSRRVSTIFDFGLGALEARHDTQLSGHPVAMVVGDLDRDGRDDAVVVTDEPAIDVLVSVGTGFRNSITTPSSADPHALAIADFDGDGLLDVAVGYRGGNSIEIWYGTGDHNGSLEPLTGFAAGAAPNALAVADMNGDGWPDLVCANRGDGTVQVFLNVPSPHGALQVFAPAPNPFTHTSTIPFVLPTTAPVRVEILDLTGGLVRRLVDGVLAPGYHAIAWDGITDRGDRARSGLYLAHVRSGGADAAKRIVLTR